jgi:hypothetical protein
MTDSHNPARREMPPAEPPIAKKAPGDMDPDWPSPDRPAVDRPAVVPPPPTTPKKPRKEHSK